MPSSTTILAVASAPGWSVRGIVRVSGAQTFELLRPHLRGFDRWSRGIHRVHLGFDGLELPVVVLVFVAPHSYTGEDGCEVQMPGNPELLGRVIEALIASGKKRDLDVRRAEPGEYTARAFLNGRISLIEAEGVAATIAARSDAELRAAAHLTGGALGELARGLADALAEALALVEAGIDFTDQDDVVAIAPRDLAGRLDALRGRLASHLERAVGTEQLAAIPWVILTGAPNAGKSTLFNALLGRPRAVVSPTPGTTRDVLVEPLALPDGAEVMLVDVAGAEPAAGPIDRLMQQAARSAEARAELVVRCVPINAPPPLGPVAEHELLVRTKSDLPAPASASGLCASGVTGAGLDGLRGAIAERVASHAVSLAADALALGPRHEALLRSAGQHLSEAYAGLETHMDGPDLDHPELVAAAMRLALDDLGHLAGRFTPDDVLGRVFATFCVGK